MNHRCPVCDVALVVHRVDGVQFAECPECAGIWVFDDALKGIQRRGTQHMCRLDSAFRPRRDVRPDSGPRRCPACACGMTTFHFMYDTPIMLDRCDSCEGIWVDDGELTHMAAAIEAARKPVTSSDSLEKRKAEVQAAFALEHVNALAAAENISKIGTRLGDARLGSLLRWCALIGVPFLPIIFRDDD